MNIVALFNALPGGCAQGLIWGIMAIGVFITYKILDLAENLIKLSGYIPYVDIDIVETGLRPGEKLYEELLMKSDGLMKTTSSKIFIERQTEISQTEMNHKLEILHEALEQGGREAVRLAMKQVVPTFRDPDEVNREVTALENSESEKK